MGTISRFEDLAVWKKAREFSIEIFNLTNSNGFERDFKLRSQKNASSGSVSDNIAEGFERGGTKEFIQFLSIAKGSAGEARSQLYRAFDRDYITEEKLIEMTEKAVVLSKSISGFINYLKQSGISGTKFKS